MKILLSLFFALFLFGCRSENNEPYLHYSAKFDNSKIDAVDKILSEASIENNLTIFKKNRESMKALSRDQEAFFTALYFKNDPILILTNVGTPNTIVLTATDYGKMSKVELEKISQDLLVRTNAELGISWKAVKFQH